MASLIVPLVALVVFAFVGFVIWVGAEHVRARIRARAETQLALIAKFASAQELAEFLNSDAGKLLIRGTIDEADGYHKPPPRPFHEQVGITVAWGILSIAVGGAVFYVRGLSVPSAVLIAVGIAFVINAALRVVFTRMWGA